MPLSYSNASEHKSMWCQLIIQLKYNYHPSLHQFITAIHISVAKIVSPQANRLIDYYTINVHGDKMWNYDASSNDNARSTHQLDITYQCKTLVEQARYINLSSTDEFQVQKHEMGKMNTICILLRYMKSFYKEVVI